LTRGKADLTTCFTQFREFASKNNGDYIPPRKAERLICGDVAKGATIAAEAKRAGL